MSQTLMVQADKNCVLRKTTIQKAFCLASITYLYLSSNTILCAGCFSSDLMLVTYHRKGFARLSPKQGVCINVQAIYRSPK